MFLSIAGLQLASANMLSPAAMDSFELGFQFSTSNNSMYLGQWEDKISAKLMPSYFNHLAENNYEKKINGFESVYFLNPNFNINRTRLNTNVFTNLNFSFITEQLKLTQSTVNANIHNFDQVSKNKATPKTLLKQEFYSSGYRYTTGNNEVSVNAVLVQQTFSDNSITTSFNSAPQYQNFLDDSFYNTSRGTGFSMGYKRKLIAGSYLELEYNSKIKMHEFGEYGKTYSESGNFDIPQKFSMVIGLPLFDSNKIEFAARKISYKQVDFDSHLGYRNYLNNHVNFVIRPDQIGLDDLTVYSVKFQQNINNNLFWNIDVTSRQQTSTSFVVFNNSLEESTAKFNYKIGLSNATTIGNFNIFASIANKPLSISNIGFGRFTNIDLGKHVEGVLSWSLAF